MGIKLRINSRSTYIQHPEALQTGPPDQARGALITHSAFRGMEFFGQYVVWNPTYSCWNLTTLWRGIVAVGEGWNPLMFASPFLVQ